MHSEHCGYLAQQGARALVDRVRKEAVERLSEPPVVTFSPKIFIPLTRSCNDSCGYCIFAREPPSDRSSAFLQPSEVLDIAQRGAELGCTEALFTLGDKPEMRYASVQAELEQLGHSTTVSYLHEMCSKVLYETGLLPHANPGLVTREELRLLKSVTASQGMMLESGSERLLQPGMPHHNCPDKEPSARLKCIEDAGIEKVPFTSGLLVGIGETREERLADLSSLRDSHSRHGHIGELIIQNFVPKAGTRMADMEQCTFEELLWTAAAARLIMPSNVTIQCPPNLSPGKKGAEQQLSWQSLLSAGVADFGGISPLTRDYVNPEARWPELSTLADACAIAGFSLIPRLPLYPHHARDAETWQHPEVATQVRRLADSSFYARASDWFAGSPEDGAPGALSTLVQQSSSSQSKLQVQKDGAIAPSDALAARKRDIAGIESILTKAVERRERLSESEIERLFAARGGEFQEVTDAADKLRRQIAGDDVTFVVNRNINYTNACTLACTFCAFANGTRESLRGPSYLLSEDEVVQQARDARERGASEVCMQGAIHPNFDGNSYLAYLRAVKDALPDMHVHAFSPLEIWHGAHSLDTSIERFIAMLKENGLGSLPGTAAEILDDHVREVLCPDKLLTQQWLDVMNSAHRIGVKSTSTIMFGHVSRDSPRMWANHLNRLRDQQEASNGFTEFVPLPYVHTMAPAFLMGISKRGPTLHECFLMHSVARLALQQTVPNVQASWVKMGPERSGELLSVGANDLGGTIQKESITSAAGASHGQELPLEEMKRLAERVGRRPVLRNTTYERRKYL